jgi:hypothetical protein
MHKRLERAESGNPQRLPQGDRQYRRCLQLDAACLPCVEILLDRHPSTAGPAIQCANRLGAVGCPLVFGKNDQRRRLRATVETARGFDLIPVPATGSTGATGATGATGETGSIFANQIQPDLPLPDISRVVLTTRHAPQNYRARYAFRKSLFKSGETLRNHTLRQAIACRSAGRNVHYRWDRKLSRQSANEQIAADRWRWELREA